MPQEYKPINKFNKDRNIIDNLFCVVSNTDLKKNLINTGIENFKKVVLFCVDTTESKLKQKVIDSIGKEHDVFGLRKWRSENDCNYNRDYHQTDRFCLTKCKIGKGGPEYVA